MADDKLPRSRDHRLTKSPEAGSAPQRAVTQGAEMHGVEDADFTDLPESTKALEAVPRGEFEDLNTNPIALDFASQRELEKHRAKTTAVETRATLVYAKRNNETADATNNTVNRLLDILEKREDDEIAGKRWTREQWGKFLAPLTGGTLLGTLISLLVRYFMGHG